MAKRKAKQQAAPTSPDEAGFVTFIEANPEDTTARAAYADWLAEHGRRLEAAQQRDAAGLSEVQYKLRRKSDGLFSECREGRFAWTLKGKGWRRLADLRAHIAAARSGSNYYETPVSDVEVVAVEIRAVMLARMPLEFKKLENNYHVMSNAVIVGAPVDLGPA
jgi:uncharacterized protein (TIGR02996 family)